MIILDSTVLATLGEALYKSNGYEFSGVGYIRRQGGDLICYDAIVLATGTWGEVSIDPFMLAPLASRPDRENLRLHFHAHPMGNGIPGPHNWSGQDRHQIETMPLGSFPELMGWSCSIVHTPKGWVGRIDNHITGKTAHVEVWPAAKPDNFDWSWNKIRFNLNLDDDDYDDNDDYIKVWYDQSEEQPKKGLLQKVMDLFP